MLLSVHAVKNKVCGDDKYTGKNYDHRRGWVEAQILKLTDGLIMAGLYIWH